MAREAVEAERCGTGSCEPTRWQLTARPEQQDHLDDFEKLIPSRIGK
jgi:hypothetical protein